MNPRLTREGVSYFDKAKWRTAPGREVYFLVENTAQEKLMKQVMRTGRAFQIERSLPGFMAYAFISPTAFLVSRELVFEEHTGNKDAM